jgi:hypothetical protein
MLGWDRHASDLFYKNPSYFYIAQGNRSNTGYAHLSSAGHFH